MELVVIISLYQKHKKTEQYDGNPTRFLLQAVYVNKGRKEEHKIPRDVSSFFSVAATPFKGVDGLSDGGIGMSNIKYPD